MQQEYFITHKDLAFLISTQAQILMWKTIEDVEINLSKSLAPYMYSDEIWKTKRRINAIIENHNAKFFNTNQQKENGNWWAKTDWTQFKHTGNKWEEKNQISGLNPRPTGEDESNTEVLNQ